MNNELISQHSMNRVVLMCNRYLKARNLEDKILPKDAEFHTIVKTVAEICDLEKTNDLAVAMQALPRVVVQTSIACNAQNFLDFLTLYSVKVWEIVGRESTDDEKQYAESMGFEIRKWEGKIVHENAQ